MGCDMNAPAELPDERPLILVVDDDPDNRALLLEELELIGCRAVAAADGAAALALVRARPFDLMLLDVMMPGVGGMEVLRTLRDDPRLRLLPVIMISGMGDHVSVARSIEFGADDYLRKPFDPVMLKARISGSLQKKRWHDQEAVYLARLERQIAETELERARADALLESVLPSPALAELKATGGVAPRRYENVAVLFADIVDFTRYSEAHPAERVVADLDRLIQDCEWSLAEHGLEKIKTIGDGLVATGNLSQRHRDPVMAAARAGRAILSAAAANPAGWNLRIGISFGPVVAGVVGRSKLAFDAWGDPVNLAARLAGIGCRSAVYLSETAWAAIAGRASAVRLEPVLLKGKGPTSVYRLGRIGS